MNRSDRHTEAAVKTTVILLLTVLVTAAVLSLSSCRTCRQAESLSDMAVISRTDTVRDIRIRVDSVHVADSVVTVIRGDTVVTDRWHREYRDRLRVDTVERLRWRTVYRTRTQTVTLTPKPTVWQRIKEVAGFLAILALAAWLTSRLLNRIWK